MPTKPSSALCWRRRQRDLLSGARHAHPHDERVDRLAVAWGRVGEWLQAGSDLPAECSDPALEGALEAARRSERPRAYDPVTEELRFYVCEVSCQAPEAAGHGAR